MSAVVSPASSQADRLADLTWRGLINDCTDHAGVGALPTNTSFYIGFDPTGASLHVGHLLGLIFATHLARAGLQPIILFGGATAAIGDPSGRRTERQLLDRTTIDANVSSISKKVADILARFNVQARYVNNADWTIGVGVLDFLRDVGKHFSVNAMMQKESVKIRLEGEGLSFTEFSYMLLQSFDFLHLYRTFGCRLQCGGSDQWGNITAGLDLIRRHFQGNTLPHGDTFALSFPLITDSQGRKFGKSVDGAVWLDAEKTSPYQLRQFWLNQSDDDAIRYLPFFSFRTKADIEALVAAHRANPGERLAQRTLADDVCTFVHGAEATDEARKSAAALFGGGANAQDLGTLAADQVKALFGDVPSSDLSRTTVSAMTVVELFAETKLVSSKGEARRLIQSGGAYINNARVADGMVKLDSLMIPETTTLVLRSGKKNYHVVRLGNA